MGSKIRHVEKSLYDEKNEINETQTSLIRKKKQTLKMGKTLQKIIKKIKMVKRIKKRKSQKNEIHVGQEIRYVEKNCHEKSYVGQETLQMGQEKLMGQKILGKERLVQEKIRLGQERMEKQIQMG